MTDDLWALVAAIVLATAQLAVASVLTLRQLGGEWVLGPRDTPREAAGVRGRFVRAHRNWLEIFRRLARRWLAAWRWDGNWRR